MAHGQEDRVIGKPKANGMRGVWVYDPTIRRKRYAGQRPTLKAAKRLEAAKIAEYSAASRDAGWTVEQFAVKWLTDYHGANTTRPAPTTYLVNDSNLRRFRREYGARLLASVTRDEAYGVARARPHEGRSIAAMFATAVDLGLTERNPFERLGLPRSRGRRDIDPLTEAEVERLAAIALTTGHWGKEFSALILWLGWTGMRPGEACGLGCPDIDWTDRTVRIERNMRNDGTTGPVKRDRNRTIVLAEPAAAAARTLRRTNGQLFRTPTGKDLRPNCLREYWRRVRTGFTAELGDAHWLRRRLAIDPQNHLDPYELRHHCGSMLADRGLSSADIAAYLGNSVAICEAVYIHPYRDRQRARIRAALDEPRAVAGARAELPSTDQQAS